MVLAVGWLFLVENGLFAQTPTATVTGLVTDQSSAVVPGTTLTLVNTDTGISRTSETGSDGYYTFTLVPAGVYRMSVEKTGFERIERTGIRLDVQQTARLDYAMQLGSVTQAVTVSAAPPLLQQETSSISQLVDQHNVAELPLLGRNPYALVFLTPGVYAPASYNNLPVDIVSQTSVSINGSRGSQNEYLLDGVLNTSPGNSGPVVTPSVDAVQEYRVTTNNYSAEYGRAGGGVFNVATKSGANTLHGNAYDYVRNTDLNSNDFFSNRAGLPVAPFHFNQFGFTLGGPIRKNKTFFFGGYEGVRQVQGVTFVGTVPTALQRAGNFSQTYNSSGAPITIYNPFTTAPDPNNPGNYIRQAFANNLIPANLLNTVSTNVLQLVPLPNTPGAAYTGANNFTSAAPSVIHKDDFSSRLDHLVSDRQKIFGEFFYDRSPWVRSNVYSTPASPVAGPQLFQRRGLTLNDTYVISPTSILSFSYGFNRMTNVRYPVSNGYNLSQLGFPATFASQVFPVSIPAFTISGFGGNTNITNVVNSGVLIGDTGLILFGIDSHDWQASMTKIIGRHTLKLGGLFCLFRQNAWQDGDTNGFTIGAGFTQGPNPTTATSTAGYSFASYLLGTADSGSIADGAPLAMQLIYYGGYAQDDFKLTPKLTVNLGLRYEYQSSWTERHNRLTDFNFQAVPPLNAPGLNLHGALAFVGVNGNPRGQWNSLRDNIAPRLGFAYSLNPKTVLRGGGGMFYSPGFDSANWGSVSGFGTTTTFVGSLNSITPYNLVSNPFPNGLLQPVGSSQGSATLLGQAVTFTDRNFKTPISGAWNFQVQRQLPRDVMFAVAYIGSRGWEEYSALQFNQLPDSALSQGSALLSLVANPFYGQITTGALAQPTVSQAQLLRPFPQFQGVSTNYSTWASSTYNALQITAEKRLSHGISFNASYTWSKLMDNNTGAWDSITLPVGGYQDYNNLRAERAVSALDIPHRFVAGYTWELPFGAGRQFVKEGWASKLVGGWQIEGITTFESGQTLGVADATNNSNSQGGGQRPIWNGVNPAISNPAISKWFNTSVFSQPAAFTFGNTPRTFGSLHAMSMGNFDFSMIKNTQITERLGLQFRAEAFNLFNTPQFGPPATSYGAGTFGTVSSQLNPARIIQLALKLQF